MENTRLNYAAKLLQQIKGKSPQSAYWLVSVLATIRDANPAATAEEVFRIVCEALPEEAATYREYVKTS